MSKLSTSAQRLLRFTLLLHAAFGHRDSRATLSPFTRHLSTPQQPPARAPAKMKDALAAAVTMLASTLSPRVVDFKSFQITYDIHRRLQDATGGFQMPEMPNMATTMSASTSLQTFFLTMRDPFCTPDAQRGLVSMMTATAETLPIDTWTQLLACACSPSMTLTDRSLDAIYTTMKNAGEGRNPPAGSPDMTDLMLNALPAILSTNVLCNRDCQTAWNSVLSWGMNYGFNNYSLAPAQAALAAANLPASGAMVPSSMISAFTTSTVGCMCNGINYRQVVATIEPMIQTTFAPELDQMMSSMVPAIPSGPSTGGSTGGCSNTCSMANDGDCDDGGLGSEYSGCTCGTDCADCGSRTAAQCTRTASPSAPAPSGGGSSTNAMVTACQSAASQYASYSGAAYDSVCTSAASTVGATYTSVSSMPGCTLNLAPFSSVSSCSAFASAYSTLCTEIASCYGSATGTGTAPASPSTPSPASPSNPGKGTGAMPLTNINFDSSFTIRSRGASVRVSSFNEFAVIAGQSGISPSYIVSLRRNATSAAASTSRLVALMAWGSNRLDSQGTPCTGFCANNCEVSRNPLLMPACGATVACPPAGVAGYRIRFTTVLRKTIEQFNTTQRNVFKARLASYVSGFGAAVNATDITLSVSAGSVAVESTIETSSALDSYTINDAVANMSTEAAQLYIDADVESLTAPTKVSVAGQAGSLGAPAMSTEGLSQGPNGDAGRSNPGGMIGGIFGGIFGIVMLGVCVAWMMSMNQKQPLASQQPVVSVHTGASVKNAPPGAHRPSITQPSEPKKAEDIELAEKEDENDEAEKGDEKGDDDERTSHAPRESYSEKKDDLSSRSDD